jgi:type IV pilus assembly protein PilN
MIRINLFPFRAARIKENIRRQIFYYFGSLVILFLLMTLFYVNYASEVKSLRQDRDTKKKKLDSFKDTNAKIKAIKEMIAEVELKLDTIKRLEEVKTGPVRLLDDIATSVPKDKLWLISLRENKGTLSLEGTAMDNETVADFMNMLESKETIKTVALVRTKQREVKGFDLNLKDFALQCTTYAFKERRGATKKGR